MYEWLPNLLLGFPLGLLAENAGEWLMHRYLLHGFGRRRGSAWAYHLSEHHRICRERGMVDPGYREWPLRWNTQGKEIVVLLSALLIHAPLLVWAPGYVAGMCCGIVCYYRRHRKSHLDPEWAKTHLPWHYRHHMGENPNADWCVTWPWFDRLMGTAGKRARQP